LVADANNSRIHSRSGHVQKVACNRSLPGHDAPYLEGPGQARSGSDEVLGLGKYLPAYHLANPSLAQAEHDGSATRFFSGSNLRRPHG
jgi:hypothetical protein